MVVIDGVRVAYGLEDADEKELKRYIDYVEKHVGEKPEYITVSPVKTDDGEERVTIEYGLPPKKFERIRRITGYLVGTIDRWNNAKQAEEKDRVKHGL